MLKLPALLLLSLGMGCLYPLYAQTALGLFDNHQDIGAVTKAGTAAYIEATGQYVISGAGYNIWHDHDEFQFAWKKIKGDFIVYTRASLVGRGVEVHRKLGWMARKSLEGNAAHISAAVHGDGLTSLQYRKSLGAVTAETRSPLSHADVIQLERKGNSYTMRVARFGEPFVSTVMENIDLGEEIYVGLFVGSHHTDVLETGVFSDVRITIPAPDRLVQYKDYIGSRIELLDVASGSREIVFSSAKSLQAPNWTADNRALIYNSEGLLYRFNLTTRTPSVLPTGDVTNNNNDHVISFDGRMLGLSSGIAQLGGSVIYTVPITGGAPKQITPVGPSYLHGWSPDGKLLVFTGRRNQDFDIYTVPSTGGKEVQLTHSKGLDDGPEYTPDGKYIYFNSARTGTMQIWRMKADGSEQQAVTDGRFHDWFPHISPDGKWIVFLSFLKEAVDAEDHPFYQQVYLRLMPVSGGAPTIIAYLYGGQGTINTASWSPDSKRIAFISNSLIP